MTEKYKLLQLYPGSPNGFDVGDVIEVIPHCTGPICKRRCYIDYRGRVSNRYITFSKYPNIWEKIKS